MDVIPSLEVKIREHCAARLYMALWSRIARGYDIAGHMAPQAYSALEPDGAHSLSPFAPIMPPLFRRIAQEGETAAVEDFQNSAAEIYTNSRAAAEAYANVGLYTSAVGENVISAGRGAAGKPPGVTHRQAGVHEEILSRLEGIIKEQRSQVEKLEKEQKELKSLITVQREQLNQKPGEARAFDQFMGQLQNELRLERLRHGL